MTGQERRADREDREDAPVLRLLSTAPAELRGRLPWSSNATFLAELRLPPAGAAEGGPRQGAADDPGRMFAVYKPASGERALWDFPRGLWRREVAAYQLSCALGWQLVPPTVEREDAPLGPGSLQFCVDAVFEEHYFSLLEVPEHRAALQRIAVFDVLANNADRKGGHCLLDADGHIWAIDHGLCFHTEPKLRTVIWDFVGERVPAELLDDLGPLSAGEVPAGLDGLLGPDETAALVRRARRLRATRRFPSPTTDFPYPWPLI